MEKKYHVYCYTNQVTGKKYVGQTTHTLEKRAEKGTLYKKGTPFREAIDKYGWDSFEPSILKNCTSQEEADCYEKYFIKKYNTIFPNGYNLEGGGRSKNTIHETTRQKLSMSHVGKKLPPVTEIHKRRLSESLKGNSNGIGNVSTRGRHWFNNGVENMVAFECPDGFVPGKLTISKS